MIDIATEPLISLQGAAKLIPSRHAKKPVNFSTVWRWVLKGVRGPSGKLVRLEGARVGGAWFTSMAAIQRFSERLTPNFETVPPPPRTALARHRAAVKAGKELEKMGV